MAIDSNASVTSKTMLASLFYERFTDPASASAVMKRVLPNGTNGYGLPRYKDHPEPWRYTLRVKAMAVIIGLQRYAVRLLVKQGVNRILTARGLQNATNAELDAAVDSMLAAGITFDHAQTQAWEDLETRRRAGEVIDVQVEVTEGKQRLADAGIPF